MKNYVKPELFYEDFELTQSVAGGCGIVMDFNNAQCQYDRERNDDVINEMMDDWGVFAAGACVLSFDDIYCYTNHDSFIYAPFNS